MHLTAWALLAILPLVLSSVPSDEITQLPGWNYPLPSKMWSGHLPGGTDVQDGTTYTLHYWYMFVEAEGPDPKSKPLLVWSNGGPGAASTYGLFAEFGPLILSDQSTKTADYNATGVPSLFYNPHAWTKAANILVLNCGGPVGYTYCDCSGARTDCGPGGNGTRCGNWVWSGHARMCALWIAIIASNECISIVCLCICQNQDDYRTARINTAFVLSWLAAFPEYAALPMFLVGESYAGVYMPMLFEGLLDSSSPPNLVGLGMSFTCVFVTL